MGRKDRKDEIKNAMTVDVEDYFQVSAFADQVVRDDWDNYPCRVERNTDVVLQMLADHNAKATFFTLGWIAQRYPHLVRRIVQAGHELASHGFAHVKVNEQSPGQFRLDIRMTKEILEDIGSVPVRGYRAASFSIGKKTPWAFDILSEEGYDYSSSIYPIHHDLYGMPEAPRFAFRPCASSDIVEIPITTASLLKQNIPCGGGGYFRLLPYAISRWAMRRVGRKDDQSCIFYFHPWEIDPDQPRFDRISAKTRFRHYTNLASMELRVRSVLADFAWDRMDRVFLSEVTEIQ